MMGKMIIKTANQFRQWNKPEIGGMFRSVFV